MAKVKELEKNTPVDEKVEAVVNEPTPETTKIGIVVDCSRLNVRKSPNLKADVLCEIKTSVEVTILSESKKDFYKVVLKDGTEGYCMKKHIKIK